MNYKQALKKHVCFQKEVKPDIKRLYEREMVLYNDKKKCKEDAMYAIEVEIPCADIPQCVKDDLIKELKDIVSNGNNRFLFHKQAATLLAYLYKEDYEKSLVAFHKFKATAFIVIEDPEKLVIATVYDNNHKPCENWKGEQAYVEVCKDVKNKVNALEDLVGILGDYNGQVKEVLKAGKKMNERNGKKNRENK